MLHDLPPPSLPVTSIMYHSSSADWAGYPGSFPYIQRHNILGRQRELQGRSPESEDLIAQMKSSRVFVLPSTREGFGISALEALASGLPVVTVYHSKNASRVFARDGCGLESSLDAADLAEKIGVMLTAGEETRQRCRMKAREYDWEAIMVRIEAYYREAGGHP